SAHFSPDLAGTIRSAGPSPSWEHFCANYEMRFAPERGLMRVSWDFLFGNLFRSCPSPFGRGRREAPGEGRKCTLIRPFGPPSPRGRRTRASISANLDTTALGGGLCCDPSTIREKSRRRTGLRLQRFRYASILYFLKVPAQPRSEERRVGKEWRSRGWPYHQEKRRGGDGGGLVWLSENRTCGWSCKWGS